MFWHVVTDINHVLTPCHVTEINYVDRGVAVRAPLQCLPCHKKRTPRTGMFRISYKSRLHSTMRGASYRLQSYRAHHRVLVPWFGRFTLSTGRTRSSTARKDSYFGIRLLHITISMQLVFTLPWIWPQLQTPAKSPRRSPQKWYQHEPFSPVRLPLEGSSKFSSIFFSTFCCLWNKLTSSISN